MDNKELLEYMKAAIEVETDLATQEQILEKYHMDIQRRKPTLKLDNMPKSPVNTEEEFSYALGFFCLAAGIFFFGVIGSITGFGEYFWALLLISSMFLIPGILVVMNVRKHEVEYNHKLSAYQSQVKSITERNQQKKDDYNIAVQQCDDSYRSICKVAQPKITETRGILEKLYSKEIIYPKYCNLPALTGMYEYFITGRCTELTSPHGAYNLYEDELRKDTIISQLNTVIENLEQIKQNQYMLYQQVKSINENIQVIASELRQIKGYTVQIAQLTALNAYYAAVNERNTRITMYYHL